MRNVRFTLNQVIYYLENGMFGEISLYPTWLIKITPQTELWLIFKGKQALIQKQNSLLILFQTLYIALKIFLVFYIVY